MKGFSLQSIQFRIKEIHPRTKKAQINTLLSLFAKGGGIITSLLTVPMTIDYLTKEVYGTWLTINSIVSMMAFLDIGIGNGLRNKFSEAITRKDDILARTYVSTAYLIFGIIQIIFYIIFLIAYHYIPWQVVFNTSVDLKELKKVVLTIVTCVSMKLVIDILIYVLLAIQKSGFVSLINLVSNVLILLGTYALIKYSGGSLFYLSVVSTTIPLMLSVISTFYFYNKSLKKYAPSIKFINVKYAKDLLSLGYKFFIIQVSVIVLFYSDNLIITQLFGPTEVTIYNVALRYFSVMNTVFLIVVTPYWSAFTEASIRNDKLWMKSSYRYLQKLWLGSVIIVFIMISIAQPIYDMWLGNRVEVPFTLNLVIGMSVIMICWNNVTVSIINGLGKIKIQLFCSIFSIIVNVPLSIFLAHNLELGSASVMIATCLSLLPASITGTMQAEKLSQSNANGIWSK